MLEPHLFALHSLTLKQMAEPSQLADIVGVPEAELAAQLEKAEADGTVLARKGKYMIGPTGREALDAAYPTAFADLRSSAAVAEAIESFETGVNKQILDLTTQWQTKEIGGEQVPNDHSDPEYDDRIIDKVGRVIEKTGKVLRPIADADPLIDRFLERLGGALTRAEGGETDYVSGLRVDSVHTVWFQMHEHLLRLTGRERPE
ncbi:hypothetical protein [Pseudonocardia endophytica]|uniref:Uncharacterized protein n=1 Tax=Pseudonocardia endophytica TaxID=401976 RepID=A0A4R1I0C3_PSEEN|nr:hypothetical protein [Pseudonocardia endophytica]TCK25879.1 hypothetical protein EV378_1706 [Pseudonocardia endophytica]